MWHRLGKSGLILLTIGVFFVAPLRRDISSSHEARVAQPARAMAASGWPWAARPAEVPPAVLEKRETTLRLEPDFTAPRMLVNPWIVPVLNDKIRLQKPPLPYWCAAVLFRLFGFSDAAARLVPCLLGAMATWLLYDLTRRLFGKTLATATTLVWLASYSLPDMYGRAMADPYLAFFTLAALWAWILALPSSALASDFGTGGERGEQARRLNNSQGLKSVLILLFYVCIALGLLAKGPPLFITLGIPLIAYHVCFRRGRPPGRGWNHVLGLAIFLLIALPWPWMVLKQVPNALELWRYESIGELSDNTENARGWWFYLPQMLFLALPWTPLLVVALLRLAMKKENGKEEKEKGKREAGHSLFPFSFVLFPSLFPAAWYLMSVMFFSFVNLKKNAYLLPALPAEAMLIAQGLLVTLAAARRLRFKQWPGVLLGAQTLMGIGFAVALLVLTWNTSQHLGFALAVPALALACVPWLQLLRRQGRPWLWTQASAYVVLFVLFSAFYLIPRDNADTPRALGAELQQMLKDDPGLSLLVPTLPETVSVRLPLEIVYRPANRVLVVKDDQTGMRSRQRGRHPQPPTPEIPATFQNDVPLGRVIAVRRVPMQSAPGDAHWKVFELTMDYAGSALPSPH